MIHGITLARILGVVLAAVAILGYVALCCLGNDEGIHHRGDSMHWRWRPSLATTTPLSEKSAISSSSEQQVMIQNLPSLPLTTSTIPEITPDEGTILKMDKLHPFLRTSSDQSTRRRLPGGVRFDNPEIGGIVIIAIILLILLCCCRGMLCDILACVCLYEICCDDAAIGGFEMM
jgi:hypothetical protein